MVGLEPFEMDLLNVDPYRNAESAQSVFTYHRHRRNHLFTHSCLLCNLRPLFEPGHYLIGQGESQPIL